MGDLRDMLLKAGLVSAEQAQRVEEAKLADQRPKGGQRDRGPRRDGAPPRPPRGDARPAREGDARPAREGDARPPKGGDGAVPRALSKEESQRLLKLAQGGRIEGRTRGQRRWYYISRAGAVPYLEISDEVMRDLEQGVIAIAESERGEAWLVTRECARELAEADPTWVRSP